MATRLEVWNGSPNKDHADLQLGAERRALSLEERMARLQRRRRRSRAQAALTGAVWLAGSGAVALIALGGMFGLLR